MGTQGDGKAGSILGVDSLMFAFFPYSRLPVITLLWGAVLRLVMGVRRVILTPQ